MTKQGEKSDWFGKCTLCGKEKQLSTVQFSMEKTYTLWLRRMCDECRNNALHHFYLGLGFTETAKRFKNLKARKEKRRKT
jgi:hypothetical protein